MADSIVFARAVLVDPAVPWPDDRAWPSAIAIADGRIVAVGSADDVAPFIGDHTRIHRFDGATVTPGLVDAHTHPLHGAQLASAIDLSTADSLQAVAEAIGAAARAGEPTAWVQGWGLDPNVWGSAPVTADVLERAAPNTPAVVRLFDGHAAIANRAALSLAHVDGAEAFTSSSEIVVDDHGTPTGLLLEDEAMDRVYRTVPPLPLDVQAENVYSVLQTMAASGLTGGHSMDYANEDGVLERVEALHDLPLRLRLSPQCTPEMTTGDFEALVRSQGTHGRRWVVDGIKFFVDGTIDMGTAWLSHPDALGQSTRIAWTSPQQYREALLYFAERGITTASHAIGDAAIAYAVDTIAIARRRGYPRVPHRIEHIEMLPAGYEQEFAALDITASMQPTHCTLYTKADHSDNWSTRLGDERADRAWMIRTIAETGANVALGSDWPIAPFDPRSIMADARTRRVTGTVDSQPNHPEQSLTAEQALAGFTIGAARADGSAAELGTIEIGKFADLTVFADDPLTLTPEALLTLGVMATFVGGEPAFESAPQCVDSPQRTG